MNKKNKILVGCLALLLVLSVGYALFSETITINGTATAKGNFQITTSCQTGFDENILTGFGVSSSDFPESGYESDSCSVNETTVSMKTGLKFPTARRGFTINFKNTGTMDAVVKANGDLPIKNDSIIIYNSDDTIYKNLTSSSTEFRTYLEEFGQFSNSVLAVIKKADGGLIIEGSDEWQARILDSANKSSEYEFYLKLEPNDTLVLLAWAYWDETATMNGYSAETTATATQDFQQVTSDMFENPEGFTCYSGC